MQRKKSKRKRKELLQKTQAVTLKKMCLKYTDALQIQNTQANTEMFQEYKHQPNAGETLPVARRKWN